MKKLIKKVVVLASLNALAYATFVSGLAKVSLLTAQMGINGTLAHNITGMLEAGMTVWGIIGLIGTFNIIGAGVLFTAKSILKSMGRKAVIGW